MAYNEAKFQTEFSKWLSRHPEYFGTAVFELKICHGKSLGFGFVKPHQIRGLQVAKKRLIYKIPDVGYDQKPFDCFQIASSEAFVVILYYVPRKQKDFVIIEVDEFVAESKRSKRASLTKERAYDIGTVFNVNA